MGRLIGKVKSPLAKRRIQNFIGNRRAYVSLYIFIVLFIITIFAEFVANDKPLLVRYDGMFYFPIIKDYLETEFGGDIEIEAEYRDPYIQGLISEEGWIVWPIIRFSYDTIDYDGSHDVVALIIYGFRISVLFGIVLTIFSTIIGIIAGAVQGYFGGLVDLIFQRFIEMWASLPSLYLIIIITSIIQPTFGLLLVILLLFRWLSLVGVVRAEFLRVRNFEFVKAARALGVSNVTIIFRHILPNAMVSTFCLLFSMDRLLPLLHWISWD